MKVARLKIPTIVLAAVALVVGVSSGAVAAKLITGADVKDNTLKSADIKNGTLVTKDLKKGGVSADRLKAKSIGAGKLAVGSVHSGKIKDGSVESQDLSTAAKNSLKTTFSGPNWGIVDRNVIRNGDSYLRAGPTTPTQTPPMGIGSLGLRTGAGSADPGGGDKAAFGDEVDFLGMGFSTITTLTYSSFTTGENITAGGGGVNLPSLEIEIDPNLVANSTNFSTAVFLPAAAANVPGWSPNDAIAAGTWFLTGAAGTATGCTLSAPCSWADLQTALDDGGDAPTILTVEFSKGRDFAFSGAVDALHITDGTSDQLFDFEPFGVTVSTP